MLKKTLDYIFVEVQKNFPSPPDGLNLWSLTYKYTKNFCAMLAG